MSIPNPILTRQQRLDILSDADIHMEPPQRVDDGPVNRQSGAKRLKIDVACDNCRAKKVKCDGVRPGEKLSLEEGCNFSNSAAAAAGTYAQQQPRAPPIPGSYSASQNGRAIAPQTQAMAKQSTSPPMASPPIPILPAINTYEMQRGSLTNPPLLSLPPPQHISPPTSTPVSRRPDFHGQRNAGASVCSDSPTAVDSMTAVFDEGASTEEFFGKSSAGSFTAQIKKAIDRRLGKPIATFGDNGINASQSAAGAMGSASASSQDFQYVLPPRRQADHLIEFYWFYVDSLYPFLDRKRWTQAYNALFSGTTMDLNERVFVATLNVILALSSQLVESQSLEQRQQASETFFRRSQELAPMSPWEPGSLELVQCLLITSLYLQSAYDPHQTWMVIGTAIRMAQGLGLHLPETSANRPDPEERERLRRIWYGCVLMDRMVSLTHGRPTMIARHPSTDVPLPLESLNGQNAASPPYYSFFVRSVRLYEIIHRTMVAFYDGSQIVRSKEKESNYDPEGDDGEDEDLDRVIQLDRCMSRWQSKLPDHLRWDLLDSNQDQISKRQAIILRMRFLHARTLLLRPMLSRFCLTQSPQDKKPIDDNLQFHVVQQGAMFCVTTAQNMINTMVTHQTQDGTVGLLPAWWYRVYFIYTAATVLIAAKLRPEVFSAVEIGRSWGQAISVLKAHEQFGQSPRRCAAALHILSSKILQATPNSTPGDTINENRTTEVNDPSAPRQMMPNIQVPDLVQQLANEFETPMPDFNPQDFAGFNFGVNDMSWLNDIQGVWELLNE
ncbi:hypothetical protein F53441_10903 [Fusarium austroafricanum]|uniref:Xylanolytic transcriptional activator regulatory domain-containing protein n=1 Tax=Fusarium austroafricanum TaxID=2364996 RepID=A0A8H4K8P2_9HYPO|nr:hypothetical protein F53441_10903 [Fusarium austroafricanum]